MLSTTAFAQKALHTLYLNNGDIFVGEIIEISTDGDYLVKTLAGQKMVLKKWQIKGIAADKENINHLKHYGGKMAVGVSILGNGLIGVNHHFGLGKNFFADANVQLSAFPVQIDIIDGTVIKSGVSTFGSLGYYFGNRFSSKRNKVKNVGIFLQAGHTFSNYNSSKIAGGVTIENFKRGNVARSFALELGYGLKIRHWIDSPTPSAYSGDKEVLIPLIHFGLRWNIYYGKEIKPPNGDF